MTDLPRGVLFDFTGTLFWIEDAETAVREALGPVYAPLAAEIARRGGINGAGHAPDLPDDLADAWHRRDLSADLHRRAYSGLAERAGLTREQAHRLYERGLQVGAWHPYPDTVEVLQRLHDASVPVALLSNIGWDPRPVLAGYGVDHLFTTLVLSDERGVMKPDRAIFELACADLGLRGEDVVMVGDSAVNDGAAMEVGARFVLVDPAPGRAPDTLLRAVGL
ncbi:HAD family hydrolase [Jatrophihabitans sp. YIM 134969]